MKGIPFFVFICLFGFFFGTVFGILCFEFCWKLGFENVSTQKLTRRVSYPNTIKKQKKTREINRQDFFGWKLIVNQRLTWKQKHVKVKSNIFYKCLNRRESRKKCSSKLLHVTTDMNKKKCFCFAFSIAVAKKNQNERNRNPTLLCDFCCFVVIEVVCNLEKNRKGMYSLLF